MLNIKNWAILSTDWYLIYVMYTFMLPSPVWIHRQTWMQMRKKEWEQETKPETQKSAYLIAKRPD